MNHRHLPAGILLIEADATEPITLAQAAANLRGPKVGGVYLESDRISKLISAARWKAEQYTGLSLIRRTVEVALPSFYDVISHTHPRVTLEYGPVGPIDSIAYRDSDGVTQTLAADQYRVNRYVEPVEVVPAYGVTWPTVRCAREFDSVRVRYEAGYSGDDSPPNPVPDDVVQAMHLYIAHYFENREAVANMNTLGELPLGVIHLLEPHRTGLGV